MAAKLAESMHPQKIYLFGSYAWGKPTKDSDVDFCLVFDQIKPKDALPLVWAAREAVSEFNLAKDIIVRTTQRMESLRPYNAPLESKIMKKGKLLYDAAR